MDENEMRAEPVETRPEPGSREAQARLASGWRIASRSSDPIYGRWPIGCSAP